MPASARLLLCLAFLAAPALSAQEAPGAIDLNVVVTRGSGPPVADLQASDFIVRDNKAPQQIASFRALTARDPVHITVVIDAVNVPYTNLAYQRDQVSKFLLANGGEMYAPTQLAFFTDQGMQLQGGYSSDGKELNTLLGQHAIGLRDVRRSSQYEMWDRLNLSLNALNALLSHEAEIPGRKMVLWISPGWPILSGPGIQLPAKQQDHLYANIIDVSNRMRLAQTVLYNINPFGAGEGVGRSLYYEDFLKPVTKPGQTALGNLSLQVLAVQSGGLVLTGSNDTAGLLERCSGDARASYQISYVPAAGEKPELYHSIQVLLTKPGLTARTRQGYYTVARP